MFTVKNLQDKLRRRDDSQTQSDAGEGRGEGEGEMVASGLLCPNCKKSFSEMEDLMLHVNNCAQEQEHMPSEDTKPFAVERRGSTQSNHSSSSFSTANSMSNGHMYPGSQTSRHFQEDSNGVHGGFKSNPGSAFSVPHSSPSSDQQHSISRKAMYDTAYLHQEIARWKSECDEQRGMVDALKHQLKTKDDILERKMKYIAKLEQDILAYEEKNDDHMAIRNELSSLQQLVTSMTGEHEKEINDLIEKLHSSQEENKELSILCRDKAEAVSTLEAKLAAFERSYNNQSISSHDSSVEELAHQDNHTASNFHPDTALMPPQNYPDANHKVSQSNEITREQIQGQVASYQPEQMQCQKCHQNEQCIAQLTQQISAMRSFSDSTVVALQQQVEQLQAKAAKPCDMCQEYEVQMKKEHRQHANDISTLQNQISSLEAAAREQNALNGRSDAMNMSLNNELNSKKNEVDQLTNSLSEVKLSLETADKEREKLRNDITSMKFLPEKNEQLTNEINAIKIQLEEVRSNMSEKEQERDRLKSELEESANQLDACEKSLFQTQHEKSQLEKEMEDQKNALTTQIETLRCNISAVREELAESEATSEEQMSRLNQNLAMLRNDLNIKEDEVSNFESQTAKLEKELFEKSNEVIALKQSANSLKEQLDTRNQEFGKLRNQYVEIRANLEGAQRVMFELGREQQSLQVEKSRWLERNWLPDDHVDQCLGCSKDFSATIRKHHCRCCGKIFCNDCSSKKASLPGHPTPVRVCNECHQLFHTNPPPLVAAGSNTPTSGTDSPLSPE